MNYHISIIASLTLVLVSTGVISVHAFELKKLVPSPSELTGFKVTEDPRHYNRENLWDYMNGGAPGYLAYGFKEMVTFHVMKMENGPEVAVDVYDMGDSLNAFGIYSVERLPDGRDAPYGIDGFKSDKMLAFWQGSYYVKLRAYDATPETAQSLSLLAQVITQKLPKEGGRPPLLSIFPEKGKLERSERYLRRDVLGQDYFTNGYRVEYGKDGSTYQVFLICGNSAEETKGNFQEYLAFMETVGTPSREDLKIGEQAFAGAHDFYGTVLFARKGAHIIGVLGLDSTQSAQEIIAVMFSRLAGMTEKGGS
jgi:hypothetical protein